ncbi:hypothetical protein HMPREF9997_00577 [Corynebacterium durum F0235]|uniref:Uncharacterized protein n=1 Tax=Corynebacterium durum F0235 TaxID=1035195 RepID=L1MJU5_9CORY|nr:hypothetical protein HMPREF9997_00577 [Corynebacterium durum F0235]
MLHQVYLQYMCLLAASCTLHICDYRVTTPVLPTRFFAPAPLRASTSPPPEK